ncbi:MAG TPA: gamma-glutamyltransferase [Chloroflexota bacterium]|jgi:gamma-glutamyltranspeptidase|nr:gamma-glutamyltransferase [Chloroflexota bacterium]
MQTGDASRSVPHPSRPMALGTHGVVATGHALATQAGLRVLQDGGNAIDAALAASAVLTVVRPQSCSIGGDLFALVHDGRSGEVVAVNASGPAPRAATVEWFRSRGHATIPEHGVAAVEVPGLVDGWALLHERFATRPLAELLMPAIALAEEGFPVYPNLAAESARHAALLAQHPATAALFLPGGAPLRTGTRLVQRDLARMLRLIARQGRAAFYGGEIGERLGRYVQRSGGLLAPADLAEPCGAFREPLHVTYRGHTVYETPPVSQGFILLEELLIAEGFDLAAMGHNRAPTIHHMVEAKKLAFADRLAYLGDPRYVPLPLETLLSPEHAARQRARIDPQRAARQPVAALDLRPRGGDTTYLCVVDADGNAASVIQSIYSAWGSGVVVPDTGILLNNRLFAFWLEDGHPNQLAPGKRTMHTLNAFLVKRGTELYMVGGTPGADDQVQTNFQVLVSIIDHGLDVQRALDATKWSSRPGTLERDRGQPYVLAVEPRLDREVVAALAALGHEIQLVPDFTIGAHEAIVRDLATGVLMGGAAPTRDGLALGW